MRPIDADETRKKMLNSLDELFENVEMTGKMIYQKALIQTIIIHHIDNAQSIDAEPVKHGHWIKTPSPYHFKCSSCGVIANIKFHHHKFCWHCGAKMDEKHEGKNADACFIDEPENPRYV